MPGEIVVLFEILIVPIWVLLLVVNFFFKLSQFIVVIVFVVEVGDWASKLRVLCMSSLRVREAIVV